MLAESELHAISAEYPNVIQPSQRFNRRKPGIKHAIPTSGEIVKSRLRRTSTKTQNVSIKYVNG